MKSAFLHGQDKKEYIKPIVEFLFINNSVDVICNSQTMNEGNDNDFGAGDLGGFLD